ncbi:phosphotransferase [Meridianimarinicoccus sp. MJW13]|uniref:phosphotransferase n=1 Tax=Meridianimarinicoccus sp. MJW13 TaxID=2720031 RepID=UPI00186642F0|nr:phosphotransferase [Fluviibacterium sp. MJW13]
MARLPHAMDENLHFLCAEVEGQLTSLQEYFARPDTATARKVLLRAGYSHNLQTRIQRASQQALSRSKPGAARQLVLRNTALVARNLDLISRMARRSLLHAEEVRHTPLLRPEAYPKPIKRVRQAVTGINAAIDARDSGGAVKIGQVKGDLDALYKHLFATYTQDMRKSKHTEDLSNALLAANEIRRMGDALQGISEALLSVSIGQPVQFERYFALKGILSDQNVDEADLTLKPLAETRSGSGISGLHGKTAAGDEINAVFKDGEIAKVKEERQGVKKWDSVYPGLAPKILSYEKRGQSAALLIEYLPGHTFQHVLLNASDALLAEARTALTRTLRDVWRRTRTEEPADMASMRQLAQRMPDVYRVHPEFRRGETRLGKLSLPAFDTLVELAGGRETALPAPFSVHIHGDFNLDNVIYDPADRKIHFIDLHRSRFMDYVQDVSVFMVSNYRLQIQDAQLRNRVADVAGDVHAMATKFARAQGDKTFEYRLALGLARSFATSTRFVFDKAHARRMFLRARYLLELALACPDGKEARLRLPIKDLFCD